MKHWDLISNKGKLPIVFTFSCLNGYFDSPKFETIAERFLNSRHIGAVSYITHTRDSVAGDNLYLNMMIYETLFNESINRIGLAVTLSKVLNTAYSSNIDNYMNTFIIFGDPMLRVYN